MTLVYTIITLSFLGFISALVLYYISQKFYVVEDPRIDLISDKLPGANCGGCGFAGCRNFAESLTKADDLSNLFCPVGGNKVMAEVSEILGKKIVAKEPMVAVVRCNGTQEHRPKLNNYNGVASCAMEHALYTGESGCPNGCLGQGDCVSVCKFDAIKMDALTGLPVVEDGKCTACGACVKSCPRNVIELRKKNNKDRKIYVSCTNTEKGAFAKKYCFVACIGCGKCAKVCKHDAITIQNNLAYIDSRKCKLCRACVSECPTKAIMEINFPLRKSKSELVEDDAAVVL
jgi:RnfABCDGE-type electron transport complex B subunit